MEKRESELPEKYVVSVCLCECVCVFNVNRLIL